MVSRNPLDSHPAASQSLGALSDDSNFLKRVLSAEFEAAQQLLKQLPGLGYRSSERLLAHLLAERPERLEPLLKALQLAAESLKQCPITGNLTAGEHCLIYSDPNRDKNIVCVVETVPDVLALERAGNFRGTYHILHGKLSPIKGIGPEQLCVEPLLQRLKTDKAQELILALTNDIEGEATCHYLQDRILQSHLKIHITRIGFGLPSGSKLTHADTLTLSSALESRRELS